MAMDKEAQTKQIQGKYISLRGVMDERLRRRWAASEARACGRGGIAIVARATGMDRNTIVRGLREIQSPDPNEDTSRVRSAGGGRKALSDEDPGLLSALEELIDPTTRGDPETPLRWTCKSTYLLAGELSKRKAISPQSVGRLLRSAGYSLQSNQKTIEGADHPDRNAQFENINQLVKRYQQAGQPVISVDTKKKELIGQYYRAGREWRPQGKPEEVKVHDFIDPELGKAIPYGIYDVTQDNGWVSVGIDHDTATFAARAIERWWSKMGSKSYPNARRLMITADGGGSNGSRNKLWKVALQGVANKLGIEISVSHFPPGTSKWNKIEHRMFSFITQNWRGRPLISHEVVINLIAQTATKSGLHIRAELDKRKYKTGIKVSDAELRLINLRPAEFHGEWNYTILPA
jgi:hypothetical protein